MRTQCPQYNRTTEWGRLGLRALRRTFRNRLDPVHCAKLPTRVASDHIFILVQHHHLPQRPLTAAQTRDTQSADRTRLIDPTEPRCTAFSRIRIAAARPERSAHKLLFWWNIAT